MYLYLPTGTVILEHLCSLELVTVEVKSVHKAVSDAITERDIPLANLISALLDSWPVMRGCKSGLKFLF